MHYTGTIWRPPYEADSLLLEATVGCTHHKCKFCTLYSDLPYSFRMSPTKDIESDLLEVQTLRYNPASIITSKLQGLQRPKPFQRVFLTGISGRGNGEHGAKVSAEIFNRLHPFLVGPNMLTVYPESQLYTEIRNGNWEEEGELEKYRELRTLVETLKIPTYFAAMGASNAFQLRGRLPQDKKRLLLELDTIISGMKEEDLQRYRKNLPHL